MAAVCEFDCGVIAVGRCRECGKAMCTSHRAVADLILITDLCLVCQRQGAEISAGPSRKVQEDRHQIMDLAKRLTRAGAPESTVSTYLATVRKPFRGWVDVKQPGLRFWDVGMHHWTWTTSDRDHTITHEEVHRTVVTENGTIYRKDDQAMPKGYPPEGYLRDEHEAVAAILQTIRDVASRNTRPA